jgi:hypothetical protein
MKEDLIFVITFGLYTKFIEAEREHTKGLVKLLPLDSLNVLSERNSAHKLRGQEAPCPA